jgi:hypothetical protein
MSRAILLFISHLPQLRSSLRTTAQRLAYYADSQGRVQIAFSYLAKDMHVSLSTAKRHIPGLIDAKIIEKAPPVWVGKKRRAINVYRFTAWVMALVHARSGSKVHPNQAKKEKSFARAQRRTTTPPLADAEVRWRRAYALTDGLGGVAWGP